MPQLAVPVASEFPAAFHPVLHTPSAGATTNFIIFLPGLGGSSQNFAGFAHTLNLPDTLCITLQPPLPFQYRSQRNFNWGDGIILEQSNGILDPGYGFEKSSKLIAEVIIQDLLVEKKGYAPREILFFGYGQGGMAGLAGAMHLSISRLSLGGVISVGSSLSSASMLVNGPKNKTPVLLLGGSKDALAGNGKNDVKKIQWSFEVVEYH